MEENFEGENLNVDDSLDLLLEKMDTLSLFNVFNSNYEMRAFLINTGKLEKAIGKFQSLDGNVLALIAKHLAPFEVILFCTRSLAFKYLCDKSYFWRTMLKLHYNDKDLKIKIKSDKDARLEYFSRTKFYYVIKVNFDFDRFIEDRRGIKYQSESFLEGNPPIAKISIPPENEKLYNYKSLYGYKVHEMIDGNMTISIPYDYISPYNVIWLGFITLPLNKKEASVKSSFLYGRNKEELVDLFLDRFIQDIDSDYRENRAVLKEYIMINNFFYWNPYGGNSSDADRFETRVFQIYEIAFQNSNSEFYDLLEKQN